MPAQYYVTTSSNLHNQTFALVPPETLARPCTDLRGADRAQVSEFVGAINHPQNNISSSR